MKVTKVRYENFISELGYATDNGNPIRELTEETINRIVTKHDKAGYVIMSASRSRWYKSGEEVPRDVLTVYESDIPNKNYTTCIADINPDSNNNVVLDSDMLAGQELASINNKRYIELKNDIISKNYSFLPVYGGFKEEGSPVASYEKSFVIFNFDRNGNPLDMNDLVSFGLEYGKKYNQDSILVKKPEGKPYYAYTYIGDDHNIGDVDMEFEGNYTLNDITQQYFTALKNIKDDSKLSNGAKPQRFTLEALYINPAPISVHEANRRHYRNEIF